VRGYVETSVALLTIVTLAGCATVPTAQTAARTLRPDRVEPAPARTEPVAAPAPAGDALTRDLLAERRRGDYPEIETDATGFTITEQVRIGSDARADYDRALVLLRQERYDEGIPLLVAVTETAPDVTAPYIDLGIAYSRAGDLEHAETALETAALLSPEHPIVHNELGILYRKTGRFSAARASYEKALAVFSDFHFARRNLAVLCDLYLADLDCALRHYTAYLQSVVDDAEVEIWVADIRNRLGQ
jgi:Flp pilus assembly protein TadD